MSDFSRIWQDAGPVLDTAFGEMMLVTPMAATRGEYEVGGPDAARPPFVVTGILDQRTMSVRNEGKGRLDADQADRLAGTCTIDFAERAFTGRDQWPRQGDRLQAVDRADLPKFEIVFASPSELGRVTFYVVRVGA